MREMEPGRNQLNLWHADGDYFHLLVLWRTLIILEYCMVEVSGVFKRMIGCDFNL